VTYNRPVNRFVAGFIGMPPMNFFNGAIRDVGGKMTFEEARGGAVGASGGLTFPDNGFTLPFDSLSPAVRDRLASRIGVHVVLGIRPEHLHLESVPGGAAIKVHLNVIEPLGNDMDVYMSTRGHDQIVGRLEARMGMTAGTDMTVYVDLRKAHFFEPGDTGMNLSLETMSPANEPAHALA
jgi:multiple sugar transport system ATP-binding protein